MSEDSVSFLEDYHNMNTICFTSFPAETPKQPQVFFPPPSHQDFEATLPRNSGISFVLMRFDYRF